MQTWPAATLWQGVPGNRYVKPSPKSAPSQKANDRDSNSLRVSATKAYLAPNAWAAFRARDRKNSSPVAAAVLAASVRNARSARLYAVTSRDEATNFSGLPSASRTGLTDTSHHFGVLV